MIESNKAWTSAEQVRRDWLRRQARRKSAPKGGAAFVATALARDNSLLDRIGGHQFAAELLGCTDIPAYGRSDELPRLIEQASDTRAQLLTLVQVLACYEDDTTRTDWRNPRASTTRYLRFLAGCGYSLAAVERRACGEPPRPDPAG